MKFKAFTLIELMVVLAIIVIIATASVPQVQVWIARNRGNQAVSQIISDFSKAKSIAGYVINDTGDYIGQRPQTAIMFKKTRYLILQKTAMSGSWNESTDTVLKRVVLPMKVMLDYVNNGSTSDTLASTPTLVFTSSGRIKNSATNLVISSLTGLGGAMSCADVSSPINGKRVFFAILRSMINDNDGIYYRIEIAESGEYVVCSATSSAGVPNFSLNTEGHGYIEL
ncbi:MAG TPA: prepilin-type N-terminal cleavage/methylation domain-containing protein [bacterium]|nr:prepilin-type N-terminal cleavage/methylation domain-containing protein [bacterium]